MPYTTRAPLHNGAAGTGGVPVAPAFPRMLLTVARIPGNDPAGGLVHQGGAFPFLNICGPNCVYCVR